jgi:hypothetical protein
MGGDFGSRFAPTDLGARVSALSAATRWALRAPTSRLWICQFRLNYSLEQTSPNS